MSRPCAVYAITAPNGKRYVGKTLHPDARWKQHVRGTHKSKMAQGVYNAIKKHGAETMRYQVLAILHSEEEAYRVEKALIVAWNTLAPNGYNLNTGGKGGFTPSEMTREKLRWSDERKKAFSAMVSGANNPMAGREVPQWHRNLVAEISRRRVRSAEERAKLSTSLKGKTKSVAHCAAISAAKKGHVPLPALAAAIKANTGRSLSDAHKEKLRVAHSGERNHMFGKKHSPERRQQCASFTGRKHTDETRAKMRAYWVKKKAEKNDN